VALHRASTSDLITWSENYGGDVILLRDLNEEVYDAYKKDHLRPQYIVIDREMTIIYKASLGNGKDLAEEQVLELLE